MSLNGIAKTRTSCTPESIGIHLPQWCFRRMDTSLIHFQLDANMKPPKKLSSRTGCQSQDNQEGSACLSVVIPAYNEEATLATIVEKVAAIPNLLEIIIVDDCSNDRTGQIGRMLAESYATVRYTCHSK